ncbi:N-acetyltransferase [Novosphingobium endophyticum]|uniref:N-acetyltransferase n=1 Tax=Novosphingobium endophyticum TaxID=1955250 RepID=A0A916TPW4_9SPHN|nr:GNAT family N-acetyltransferase [Novosphingobium endophyticum]GGB92363.1 N-acetyltransferase [Novosphingobium endophyticum]
MFIRSERLFLRPGWAEDWRELETLIADEKVMRSLASSTWPVTGEDARRFLDHGTPPRLPRFLVTLPDARGARVIGCVALERRGEDVELCYWIGRDYSGKGYAIEAARAVTGLACALGHQRIVASHFLDNPASGRVLGNAGFRQTGRIIERYSKVRGMAYPAREYALELDMPGGCDDDMNRLASHEAEKRAA